MEQVLPESEGDAGEFQHPAAFPEYILADPIATGEVNVQQSSVIGIMDVEWQSGRDQHPASGFDRAPF
ncbi:hypothetical protein SDC9_88194 [bioreactor metagenome]|uniref:Uncharacterized protein n=1 Tax=bioreactor metagenome TaxID=1076179 RepID=A0A644ZKY2_9ZZZZ